MRAARLRYIVSFQRLDTTADVYGNVSSGGWSEVFETRGDLRETRGRERVEAGALQAPMSAILMVRSDTLTRGVTESDSAVIDGVRWNIRSIANPDQRSRWLEMTVERGVAD